MSTTLSAHEIVLQRLHNQHIAHAEFQQIFTLMDWLGAIQAQDPRMMKWALGLRLTHCRSSDIEAALAKGLILRTHLLRPTWHLSNASNIHWLLDLSAAKLKQGNQKRLQDLGLTGTKLQKSQKFMLHALQSGEMSRQKLQTHLVEQAKLDISKNRGSHYLMMAEWEKLIISGSKDNSYALFDQRVPMPTARSREKALQALARVYFKSRGPARIEDFKWWSGLNTQDARKCVEAIQTELEWGYFQGDAYGFKTQNVSEETRAYLLPAYDEFVIAYQDRNSLLKTPQAIAKNGVFWPLLLIGSQIKGIWKHPPRKKEISIELFKELNTHEIELLEQAVQAYSRFLEQPLHYHCKMI